MKRNQNGQATLEYVLLLFITVTLCAGLLLKFSVGFKSFAQNLLGEYVECLLEAGELPALGTDQQSECDYNKLVLGAGKNNLGATSTQQNLNEQNTMAGRSEPKSSSTKDGGGGTGSGSSSGGTEGGLGGFRNKKGAIPVKAESAKNKDGEGSDKFRNISTTEETIGNHSDDSEDGGIRLKGVQEEDIEKAAVEIPIKGGQGSKKPQLIPIKNLERKVAQVDTGLDLSFASIAKYLVIILIVLALIIFFGNQVMQFQKSKEN